MIDRIADGILQKVMAPFNLEMIKKSFGINISPTTVVLLQELERFNKLVHRITSTLSLLRRVCFILAIIMLLMTLFLLYL